MNFNWGKVPTKTGSRKQETFTNPVMIFAAVEKKGAGRKITFNKAAQEALSIAGEDFILLGMESGGSTVYIRKASESEEGALQLTKTCSFSNKRWFESIVKANSLDITVQNVFNITSVDGTVFEATLRGSVSNAATPVDTETVAPAPEVVEDTESATEAVEAASQSSSTEEEKEW